MTKFRKCKAEIYSFGIDNKPVNPIVIELLKEDGIIPEFNLINLLTELKATHFDYILSLSASANTLVETEFKTPLKFNYNFALPQKETKENLEELKRDIKQYMERFCKMYLNEYQ